MIDLDFQILEVTQYVVVGSCMIGNCIKQVAHIFFKILNDFITPSL